MPPICTVSQQRVVVHDSLEAIASRAQSSVQLAECHTAKASVNMYYVDDGFSANIGSGSFAPNMKHNNLERAAYDLLITMTYERLFERLPNWRIASIENGAEFLPDLFSKKITCTATRQIRITMHRKFFIALKQFTASRLSVVSIISFLFCLSLICLSPALKG